MAENKKTMSAFWKDISEFFRKKSLAFKVTITIASSVMLVGIVVAFISLIVFDIIEDFGVIMPIISIVVIFLPFVFGIPVIFFIELMGGLNTKRNQKRKRRKQIREAGLDQLEDGEQAISSEEFEERYNQRLAMRQNNVRRRRPPIVLLNERPSNEKLLKKMIFKGKITGEKCSICKLDLRKKQTIVQCPKCLALFHYDHMNNWFEKNNDCPVCDELLVK
ncbi:MAG: RING finger domain-containing protein [Candidatus Heimdallarchaeota archaeon]